MKIIILYASCGAGHRRAAEALYSYFKENYPGLDLNVIDALQKTNLVFRIFYSRGYDFLVTHGLWLWHFFFRISSIKSLRILTNTPFALISRMNAGGLSGFLAREKPDFIISTHFFPSDIAAYLKKKGRINSKVVTVITDFGIHPLWISEGTGMYVVASNSSKEQLLIEGVRADIIKVLGIPIDMKFSREYERENLCKAAGLDPDKFTVLISTGSFGMGQIEEIVELLHKEVQLLVVSARNKILYEKLKEKDYSNVRVYGFIENIQELMAISDIIITKPGGSTISESLAMGLVPVFIAAIPGQETENAKVLSEMSVGLSIAGPLLIKDAVLGFRDNPGKLKEMKTRINEMKRPFATKELCGVICQGSIRAGS
ncbi:MAG: glycosyltransferase [Candidatus Omnitrophota bacterium]